MIIKYINENVFGSYKGKKRSKEEQLADLKKETGKIIENSIKEGFLKKVKPFVIEKYEEILYNTDFWNIEDNLNLKFVTDIKRIELELKKCDNPNIDNELIVKLPVIHLDTQNLSVKFRYNTNLSLHDTLVGVMNGIYNYFQYSDKIRECYEEYFSELYPDKKYHTLCVTPKLNLLTHDIKNYGVFASAWSLLHINDLFFKWFDNYQITCKTFILPVDKLKIVNCERISELFNDHIICDRIILVEIGNSLESVKGIEKLLSFEKLNNREYQVEIRFAKSYSTKPGLNLKDSEKVCSEKLIREITGKSYDDNILEHRIGAVDDPRDMTKEDLKIYQANRTKITSLMCNINKDGVPIQNESDVGVDVSNF